MSNRLDPVWRSFLANFKPTIDELNQLIDWAIEEKIMQTGRLVGKTVRVRAPEPAADSVVAEDGESSAANSAL